MPKPLDPEKREQIEAAIRQGKTRNQIARDHGVSGSTVSKIGKEIEAQDGSEPFERSQTKRATVRRAEDLAARRVELAHLLMDDAFRLRERQWELQSVVQVVAVKGGGAATEVVQVPSTSNDHRNYMTALGIAVDKVRVLTEGSDSAEKEAANLIKSLVDEARERKASRAAQ